MSGTSVYSTTSGDGDLQHPFWIGNNYSPATINSATGTGSTTLVTGNPGYFITELGYQIDANATIAAAGMISLTFTDSSFGTIANFRIWIPSTAGAPTVPTNMRQVNQGPFVWSNRTANSTLSVAVNTALTAASIRAFVRYGITNIVG